MLNTKTLKSLFPDRKEFRSETTPLQQAFQRMVRELTETPELQQVGIAQYLPLIQGLPGLMSDDDIRAGREVMRKIVHALDDVDNPRNHPLMGKSNAAEQSERLATETGSADDSGWSYRDGENDAGEGTPPTLQNGTRNRFQVHVWGGAGGTGLHDGSHSQKPQRVEE